MNRHRVQDRQMRTPFWEKCWKWAHFAEHAIFVTEVSRQQVARSSCQNTQGQNFEKFSKCFSWLEGLPARESRAEPRKSLSNPRDWTFHLRTSRQNWLANSRLRPATELPKQGKNEFLKFSDFKNKILSKNT